MELDDLEIVGFRSALPKVQPPETSDINNAIVYQAVAKKISSRLSDKGVVRLKAAMSLRPPMTAGEISELVDNLHRYDFDTGISGPDGYGFFYLDRFIDVRFDMNAIADSSFAEIGEAIMERKGCTLTDYGLISSMDGSLYGMITRESDEDLEESDEGGDEQPSEDDDMEMG